MAYWPFPLPGGSTKVCAVPFFLLKNGEPSSKVANSNPTINKGSLGSLC